MPVDAQEDSILAVMRQNKVLQFLTPDDQRFWVRNATLKKFRERESILHQGDRCCGVMIVLSGFVKLSVETAAGRAVILEIAGPGNVFGELEVLNGWSHTADVSALSSCQILAIESRAFTKMLAQAPAALFWLIRVLCRRVQRTTERVIDSVDLSAPQRVAKALIDAVALHSVPVQDGLRIGLKLSQQELGAMTGLTRESINKHVSGWQDEGIIKLSERSITILDVESLQQKLAD